MRDLFITWALLSIAWVLLSIACRTVPKSVPTQTTKVNPTWCLGLTYKGKSKAHDAVVCVQSAKHCSRVRKAAMKYGHMGGVTTVGGCAWSPR